MRVYIVFPSLFACETETKFLFFCENFTFRFYLLSVYTDTHTNRTLHGQRQCWFLFQHVIHSRWRRLFYHSIYGSRQGETTMRKCVDQNRKIVNLFERKNSVYPNCNFNLCTHTTQIAFFRRKMYTKRKLASTFILFFIVKLLIDNRFKQFRVYFIRWAHTKNIVAVCAAEEDPNEWTNERKKLLFKSQYTFPLNSNENIIKSIFDWNEQMERNGIFWWVLVHGSESWK